MAAEHANRVYIVTGGSEGIGLGMTVRLLQQGARVVIASRDAAKAEAALPQITAAADVDPEPLAYICTDICKEHDNTAMVEFAVERFGRLDGIVNNAVHPGDFKMLADEPLETFEQVMRTNVTGTFLGMKAAINRFIAQGAAAGDNYSIINVSSGATRDVGLAMAPYIASKRAVEGLTEAAAKEYGRMGIRVNTLLFGVFATQKTLDLHAAMPAMEEKNAAKHHVGRFGDPVVDAGEAASYLLSERSGFVTGATLFVDGGMCL